MSETDTPKTIVDWALHWAATAPHLQHFTQPMGGGDENLRTWTMGEAVDEARRMASYLHGLKLPPGSKIAICSKNCAYWVMADWAIWMAGHVSVPVYPTLAQSTLRYVLEHSEAQFLFVGKLDAVWQDMKGGVPEGMRQVAFPLSSESQLDNWSDIVQRHEPLEVVAKRRPDEMATIVYTSGSTGEPKGVMLSFGAMTTATEGIIRMLELDQRDRMLSYLPLAHTFERWIVGCASTRTPFQLFFAESTDTFVFDLQRARPTLFISVPRLWLKFQAGVFEKLPPKKLRTLLGVPLLGGIVRKKVLRGLGLDAVRFAGSGSAPIPAELLAWYRDLGLELLEGYGMSENFNYSHVSRPGRVRAGYVGDPYEGVECRIDEGGEILVKSPAQMLGYFKNPQATRDSLTPDGFLRTGDRGELDAEGRLKITGRVKEIFKTAKGKYVAPAPIENQVVGHPRVESCCVTGAGRPQPYALVLLSDEAQKRCRNGGRPAIERELVEHLARVNDALDSVEKLSFFAIVDGQWLPENGMLTPTLKIKRAKIEETYGPQAECGYDGDQKVVWLDSV